MIARTETHAFELRALHQADARYRSIVETAREGIWICDCEGKTLFVSPRLADMLGYTQDEMVGRPIFAFMTSYHDREFVRRQAGDAFGGQREFELRRKDGAMVWTILEVSVMTDDDGRPVGSCAMVTDISERRTLEEALSWQTLHDPLTGLLNRALLTDRLEQALRRCERQGTHVAVYFLDLDGFKAVNDQGGHLAGDAVLIRVAEQLQRAVRASDTVARVGGDEFVIVAERTDTATDSRLFAERLREQIGAPFELNGQSHAVGVSIGIAIGCGRDTGGALLRDADLAMYEAKAHGGGRVHFVDDDLRARAEDQRRLHADLALAVERDELRVRYQPVVSVGDERVVGAEALLRWDHPERGMLEPSTFIPLAEKCGLIGQLDEWILEQVCRQLVQWSTTDLAHLSIAVNLSGRQFSGARMLEHTARTLLATGADPRRLVFEITETAVMTDVNASATILRELRAMGITVAVDDFGTGFSSLAYLKQLPIDVLKVDRSFVDPLGDDDQDTSIVTAIVAMAQALGLTTVAEGVERPEHLRALRSLGCDYAQGFLWARPLAADEFGAAARSLGTGSV